MLLLWRKTTNNTSVPIPLNMSLLIVPPYCVSLPDFNECQSNPCQSGGTCINGLKKYVCVCPRERTGENCDRSK